MLISNSRRDFWSSVNLESHFSLLNDDAAGVEEPEVGGAVGVKKEVIDLDFLTVVVLGVVVDWGLVSSESGALRLVFEDIVGYLLACFVVGGGIGDGMVWGNGERKEEEEGG